MLAFIDEIMTHRLRSGFRKFPPDQGWDIWPSAPAFHSFKTTAAVVALATAQWLLNALNSCISWAAPSA